MVNPRPPPHTHTLESPREGLGVWLSGEALESPSEELELWFKGRGTV